MAVTIKNSKNVIDKDQRISALQTLENKATTSQLKKLEEFAKLPNALEKFEKNYTKLKTLIKFS